MTKEENLLKCASVIKNYTDIHCYILWLDLFWDKWLTKMVFEISRIE